jgi:hypothetical protein
MNCVDREKLHRTAPIDDKEDVYMVCGIVLVAFLG